MGRLFGVIAAVLAFALLVVPAAGAAPSAAALAAEMPTPSCAEGPEREGDVIVGTPCADHIVVPPTVTYVDGGSGDDVIEGSLTTSASTAAVTGASGNCEVECHLEVGSQTFEGGAGDDIVYGDRGNDILRGNAGDDRLYGGIGDDRLEGGPGNDWLSGGFGADTIDGQEGDDFVRGDGTIDHIFDTGGGYDTLSFATGVTPGFGAGKVPATPAIAGFPKEAEGERGVFVNLGAGGQDADDGIAASGGGVDEVQPGVFERIIGSPFSDYIVGSGANEEILGGGGADVILGGGGVDAIGGGADGDYLEAGPGSTVNGEAGVDGCVGGNQSGCEGTAKAVHLRDPAAVSVGEVAAGSGSTDVYLVGSSGADNVTATYTGAAVAFTLGSGSSFDAAATDAGGCVLASGPPATATCPLGAPATPNVPALDALLIAGMAGNDTISTAGFPAGATVVGLGGAGADTIEGGPSEDVLVDGPPSDNSLDTLRGGPGDDALLHNGGPDHLDGGEGSDLFLSVSICDGETIEGGAPLANDRDNASWARLPNVGVDARLDLAVVGEVGANEAPVCPPGEELDHLSGIEDLEGSEGSDVLYGNEGENQLLGHRGEDTYRALGGNDTIFANSGTRDRVIDCGEGEDTAVVDLASVGDPAPLGCERIREGSANEFETEIEQPVPAPVTVPAPPTTTPTPAPPPPVVKPKPTVDRTAPRTKLLRRPATLVRVRPHRAAAVVFRFAANERSRFECKLDAKPYRRCHSPLRAELRPGRHTFRVFAIDAAGNRDETPALVRLRVAVAHGHRHRHR